MQCGSSIELEGIECALLSRFSPKSVATKWRIYKGNSPQDFLLEKQNRFLWKLTRTCLLHKETH